jgi:hypothetical protein
LIEVTLRPALFSKTPMLLAVTPLPNPDRTPPLTTTYFMHINGLLGRRASHINIPQPSSDYVLGMMSEE